MLPEVPMPIEEVCFILRQGHQRGKQSSIVIVAEGAGKGYDVAAKIAAQTGYSTHVTVLGYIQRGGSPTATDNIIGSRMGGKAIDCILANELNCLIAWQKGDITTVPYAEAFATKRSIDTSQYELARILAL